MGFFKNKKSAGATKATKAAEKSRVLFDDEFFDVDNGIERLEISELGIYESRSRASVEAKPTLQERVRHASAAEDEPIAVKHGGVDRRESDIIEPEFTDVNAMRDTQPPKYDVTAQSVTGDSAPTAAAAKFVTADPGADEVFTACFDPFEMIMSEELASKPSSRSLLDKKPAAASHSVTVNENISELTEQDIERARRNAEFERRKAELLKRSRPEPETSASAAAEPTAEEPTEDIGEVAIAEDNEPDATPERNAEQPDASRRTTYSFVPDYTASPSVNAAATAQRVQQSSHYGSPYAEGICNNEHRGGDARSYAGEYDSLYRGEQARQRSSESSRAVYRRAASFAAATVAIRRDSEPSRTSGAYDRREEPRYGYTPPSSELTYAAERPYYPTEQPTAAQSYDAPRVPAYGTIDYTAPKEPAYNIPEYSVPDEPLHCGVDTELEDRMIEPIPRSAAETKEPEYVEPSFKPYAPIDDDEDDECGLVFELDTRKHISGKADEPVTLATERAMLFDGDGEEIDAPDDAEDDGWESREIPPEEQNPEVIGMRDMFTAFRNEEESEEGEMKIEIRTAEDGYTAVMPEYNENDILEDGSDSEDGSDGEEEDAPPFDAPTAVSAVVEKEKRSEKTDKPKKPSYKNYKKPPIELLGLDSKSDDDEISQEIQENTRIIIETLASFNVTASIKGVDRGPRITRYEVVPAKGVTVNAITHRFDDITLNLAADGIRMEAPIPGKSAIGFEIPNKNPANVRLRELLECDEFQNAKSNTFVCIGKDVAGNPVFGDIGKFPHALVAGATGMGKSVAINSIMISMLYKARPDQVKFIMIDPKKVEFRMYSGIPHLLIPVITEAKQAAGALMWAVEEMERRYDLIEKLNIRNIEAYNERQAADPSIGEHMPKIIIVIDELNDLMMQVRDPVEDLIMRIAQKARAAGIHLIIGTQRPDVKVITGTIKANINTRISCKVTSVVDSRTILEMAGAEKLLNRGDMLFKPVDKTKPIRVQGAFVSDSEVEAIMDFLKNQDVGGQYDDEIFAEINKAAQKCGNKKSGSSAADDDFGGGDDECGYYNDQKFLDAVELAIRSGKISTSLLQRKMSIGYGKAAKYIDAMEEIGVVGEPNGQKPRDVLLSLDEWYEKLSRVGND